MEKQLVTIEQVYPWLVFLFKVFLVTYIVAAALEVWLPGFVNNNFPLAYLLWFDILLGLLILLLKK